jgi:hypothetical protein
MKVTEKREVKYMTDHELYTVCDFCKKEIELERFDAFEFTLELKTGDSYPECGSGEVWTIDACQNCAELLFDRLDDDGVIIDKKEWDW